MDWKLKDIVIGNETADISIEATISLEELQAMFNFPSSHKPSSVKTSIEKPAKRKGKTPRKGSPEYKEWKRQYNERYNAKLKAKKEPAEEPDDDVSDEQVEALEKLGKASKKAKAIADTGPYNDKYSKERS